MVVDPPGWLSGLNADLSSRRAEGLLREQFSLQRGYGAVIRHGDSELVNFCSNDYLGFAAHPDLIQAWSEAALKYGVGSGASPLICGRFDVHDELEQALAAFCGRERALLFQSGFQANLGAVTALAGERRRPIVMDRLCHASLIDAARLCRGRLRRFAHGDGAALQDRLENLPGDPPLVITESVFSMDGDTAPLVEYARVCKDHGALFYVDEAHAFGVLGSGGGGGLEEANLTPEDAPLMMATFGKALGVSGAFVAGSDAIIESLVQNARAYIYSTAMPPAVAATVLAALRMLATEGPQRRHHMRKLTRRFRDGARKRGLPMLDSLTPIQPVLAGSARRALEASRRLYKKGYFVTAIRPPTVPKNRARLRVTLTASHSEEQVDGLLSALEEALA